MANYDETLQKAKDAETQGEEELAQFYMEKLFLKRLKCFHTFHVSCIDSWLK